jgi:hypothetical protein
MWLIAFFTGEGRAALCDGGKRSNDAELPGFLRDRLLV